MESLAPLPQTGASRVSWSVDLKNKTVILPAKMSLFGNRELQFRTCKLWQNHRQVPRLLFYRVVGRGNYKQNCAVVETRSWKYSGFSLVEF